MPRGVKKENLPSKICVTCGRPFTWRKKWERVWDEVSTCSKMCNHKRRQATKGRGGGSDELVEWNEHDVVIEDPSTEDAQWNRVLSPAISAVSSGADEMRVAGDGLLNIASDRVFEVAGRATNGVKQPQQSDQDSTAVLQPLERERLASESQKGTKNLRDTACESIWDTSQLAKEAQKVEDPQGTAGESVADTSQLAKETPNSEDICETTACVSVLDTEGGDCVEGVKSNRDAVAVLKIERRAARKAQKAERRAERQGRGNPCAGQKSCDMCGKHVDLLIRCLFEERQEDWKMVCGRCWNVASGGVADGDLDHPHYRYGGLWKNRRAQIH